MKIVHNLVSDCKLTVTSTDGVETLLEVAGFTAVFALNELPTVQVVPALGKSIWDGTIISLEGVQKGDKASLTLTVNGTTTTIIKGYVQSISVRGSSAGSSSSITLSHQASILAGAPYGSYVYVKRSSNLRTSWADKISTSILTAPGQGVGLVDASATFQQVFGTEAANAAQWPSVSIVTLAQALIKELNPVLSDDEAAEVLKAYQPANVLPFVFGGMLPIQQAIHNAFQSIQPTGNLWQGFVQAAQTMMLSIIPFNTGVMLGNPMAIHATPDISLDPGDYLSVGVNMNAAPPERIDGIVVRSRVDNAGSVLVGDDVRTSDWYVYPPLRNDKGEVEFAIQNATNKTPQYYHIADAPDWLERAFALDKREANKDNAKNARNVQAKQEVSSAYLKQLGVVMAKMLYSDRMSRDTAAPQIQLPYRTDIMPGTMVELKDVSAAGLGFFGSDMIGMVGQTTIVCSSVQNGYNLQMTAELRAVRSAADNVDADDGGVALEDPGIWQGRWVGIDINGEHLAELPEHEELKAANIIADPVDPVPGVVDKVSPATAKLSANNIAAAGNVY